MKLILPHHRRKRFSDLSNSQKSDSISGSDFFRAAPIKSGLTMANTNDKILEGKDILKIDEEGNLKKASERQLKRKRFGKEKSINLDYLNIGYYIITPLLAGVFLGLGIDYWLKTKPVFTAIFLFLGTIACFYNLLKLLKDGK